MIAIDNWVTKLIARDVCDQAFLLWTSSRLMEGYHEMAGTVHGCLMLACTAPEEKKELPLPFSIVVKDMYRNALLEK